MACMGDQKIDRYAGDSEIIPVRYLWHKYYLHTCIPWNLRDSLHGATEDPSTTNILEGRTTFRWVYMQNVRSMLLTVERESLHHFCSVCPLHGDNIFLILGSSNLSARKILVQLEDHSVRDNLNPLHVNWIQKHTALGRSAFKDLPPSM